MFNNLEKEHTVSRDKDKRLKVIEDKQNYQSASDTLCRANRITVGIGFGQTIVQLNVHSDGMWYVLSKREVIRLIHSLAATIECKCTLEQLDFSEQQNK